MALTSNSDFYVAIHDAGINKIVRHVMGKKAVAFQLWSFVGNGASKATPYPIWSIHKKEKEGLAVRCLHLSANPC